MCGREDPELQARAKKNPYKTTYGNFARLIPCRVFAPQHPCLGVPLPCHAASRCCTHRVESQFAPYFWIQRRSLLYLCTPEDGSRAEVFTGMMRPSQAHSPSVRRPSQRNTCSPDGGTSGRVVRLLLTDSVLLHIDGILFDPLGRVILTVALINVVADIDAYT